MTRSSAPAADVAVDIDAIHHQLRTLGRDRAELDAAEAHYLRAGNAVRIWEAYGYGSYAAYLEAVLGYGRKTARERIRTALERTGDQALLVRRANGTPYPHDSFWRWSAPAVPG